MTTMHAPNTRPAKRVSHTVLGAITLACAVLIAVAIFSGWIRQAFAPATNTVRADFADAQQLAAGDEVRIDGVEVGTVDTVVLDSDARGATVTMKLRRGVGSLYADAHAAIRWRTLLGGAYVVEIDRGTPGSGALGDRVITRNNSDSQVELEDVLSTDRDAARRGLRTMPRELAKALRGPRDPATLLGHLADVAPDVARGVGALRGQRTDADLRDLVGSAATTMRALDAPDDDLRALVSAAAATLQAVAARRAELTATLHRAPAVMRDTRLTTAQLDRTLRRVDLLLGALKRAAPGVAPTLRALRPTVTGAGRLLTRARPLLSNLRPAVRSLASAARSGLPLLDQLQPSIARLDTTVLPYLNENDRQTDHTLAEMIGPTFGMLGVGASAQLDNNGRFIRFPASVGSSPLAHAFCQTYAGNPDADKLIACEALKTAFNAFFGRDALTQIPIKRSKP